MDGQDVNTIDQIEEIDMRNNLNSPSFQETLSQKYLPDDITLSDIQQCNNQQQPASSNQSIYETPNQSETNLENSNIYNCKRTVNRSIQTSNATLNKTPKQSKKDKAVQATTGQSMPVINRSQSLYKNKHFMIKRTPNLPKKQPQISQPNLMRKTSSSHFEEDSFFNILNQTTNL